MVLKPQQVKFLLIFQRFIDFLAQQNQILDVEEINSADSIEDIDDFERYVKK